MTTKQNDAVAEETGAGEAGAERASETEERPNSEELRFSDAMEELEGILGRIESEEIDIDDLAGELRRATELLETARSKIRKAEVEVTQIVAGLDDD